MQTQEANEAQVKRKKKKRSQLTSNRTSSSVSNDFLWIDNCDQNKTVKEELKKKLL